MVELSSGLRPRGFARLITRLRCDGADRPLRVGRGSVPQRGGDRRRRLPGHRADHCAPPGTRCRAVGVETGRQQVPPQSPCPCRTRLRPDEDLEDPAGLPPTRRRTLWPSSPTPTNANEHTDATIPDIRETLRSSRVCSRVSRGRGHRCPRASPYARLREGIGARHPAPPRTGVPRPGPTGGRNPRRSRGGASGWR